MASESPSPILAGDADRRPAIRLGWLVWLAAIVPTALGLGILFATLSLPLPDSWGFRGYAAPFAVAFGTLGGLIVARHPGQRVGVLFAVAGVGTGLLMLAGQYAAAGIVAGWALPGALMAAWLTGWLWAPLMMLVPILFSIFPDGHFLSRRWSVIGAITVVTGLGLIGITAFGSGIIYDAPFAQNPLGALPVDLVDPLYGIFSLGLVVAMCLAIASVVARYRRAGRDERQQMKWVAAAGVLLALTTPLVFVGSKPGQVAFILAVGGLVVAAGIAVLRYRLYEIDTIINRALVYGSLTAILAGLYATTVGLLQRLLAGLAGPNSDAAVIISTLVVVSSFTPVKNRLQGLVDRRLREVGDPTRDLGAFTRQLAERVWPIDPERVLQRFASVAVGAYGASGATVSLAGDGDPIRKVSAGTVRAAACLTATGTTGSATLMIDLFDAPSAPPRRASDREALQLAATAVAQELAG